VTSNSRCWFCSEEIRPSDRTKVVADLNVRVHVGCFDRLYETEGVKSWSTDRRPADDHKPPNDDGDEEVKAS
jgi:hypothetical protein